MDTGEWFALRPKTQSPSPLEQSPMDPANVTDSFMAVRDEEGHHSERHLLELTKEVQYTHESSDLQP